MVRRGDVHYVVSEYGAINLFGEKSAGRVIAMITIAHPDYRQSSSSGQGAGGDRHGRSLGEAVKAVYPVRLEEEIEIDGQAVMIRPGKPVDERRIQEHYYSLPKEDVVSRFFGQKTILPERMWNCAPRSITSTASAWWRWSVNSVLAVVAVAESMRL